MICLTSTINDMSEPDRIEKCLIEMARGDKIPALEELYSNIKDVVYGYALSMLKNTQDAEDVLHDCCIAVYQSADRYTPAGKPMAWIITIARNLCLDKLRSRSRIAGIPEEDWEQYLGSNSRMTVEDKLMVEHCLRGLRDDEREILLLHILSGMKHREIAEMTGRPTATILSKYHRALKKIRALLEEEDR